MKDLLRLVAYILAGLTSLSWAIAFGAQPTIETVLIVLTMALVPDFISLVGHLLVQPQIERWVHTIWVVAVLGLVQLLVGLPGGWLAVVAYAGHLLVDALMDVRGVPLLWPFSPRYFYFASATNLFERLVVVAALGMVLILPHLTPNLSQDVSGLFNPEPTAAPILPKTVTIRIPHVYDLASEILVKPGDVIKEGTQLANLTTYRQYQNDLIEVDPTNTATPTSTFTPTPSPSPTATTTPTTTPTPGLDMMAVEEAFVNLERARVVASITAAPPNATRIYEVCDKPEKMLRQLWRDQIARDMAKAMEFGWEAIHVMEIDLDILEGDIAAAQAECERFEAFTENPDTSAITLAQIQVQLAELDYRRALATPTPRPVTPPTVTLTPTPTRTPSPTMTPDPTTTPEVTPVQEDDSRVYALTAGYVQDVRVASATGNEAVVEIIVVAANPAEVTLVQGNNRLEAQIVRVVDGDTIVAEVGGIEETIRLIGVDTPETKHPTKPVECFGPEAASYTASLLPPGQAVWLEFDLERRDRYNRFLAYVWLDDQTMINQLLIQQGYATPLTIKPNDRYAPDFDRLSRDAQGQGQGIWGACL